MDNTIYITKERKEALKEELEHLTTVRRTEIAHQLEAAKELGDLKENAEYHQAREDQAILEEKIRQIEYTIKEGVIIEEGHKDEVTVGATVTIAKKGSSTKMEYMLTGSDEADPAHGKISVTSPLVEAMLGKREGEFFSFTTPGGDVVEYKVVNIK